MLTFHVQTAPTEGAGLTRTVHAGRRSDAASLLAVHLNPLPPVRSMPPEEKVVSDPVSEVYMDGGMSGVILSNSAPDLQPYQVALPLTLASAGTDSVLRAAAAGARL
eukprot:919525-Rhodomonas_salina.1